MPRLKGNMSMTELKARMTMHLTPPPAVAETRQSALKIPTATKKQTPVATRGKQTGSESVSKDGTASTGLSRSKRQASQGVTKLLEQIAKKPAKAKKPLTDSSHANQSSLQKEKNIPHRTVTKKVTSIKPVEHQLKAATDASTVAVKTEQKFTDVEKQKTVVVQEHNTTTANTPQNSTLLPEKTEVADALLSQNISDETVVTTTGATESNKLTGDLGSTVNMVVLNPSLSNTVVMSSNPEIPLDNTTESSQVVETVDQSSESCTELAGPEPSVSAVSEAESRADSDVAMQETSDTVNTVTNADSSKQESPAAEYPSKIIKLNDIAVEVVLTGDGEASATFIAMEQEEDGLDEDVNQDESNSHDSFSCFMCGESETLCCWDDLLLHFRDSHCYKIHDTLFCQCPDCEGTFTLGGADLEKLDVFLLKCMSHMVRNHNYDKIWAEAISQASEVEGLEREKDITEREPCSKCDALVRADYMKRHLAKHCKAMKETPVCKCGKPADSHSQGCPLYVSAVKSENDHKCPDCGLCFKTAYNMDLHVRRCHLKEYKYVCEECGQMFFKRDILLQHCYVSHMKNLDSRKVLTCNFEGCDFTAIYNYDLNQHVRRRHLKGPFFCSRCNKECSTYYTLNRHNCVYRDMRGRQVTSHIAPPTKTSGKSAKEGKSKPTKLYHCNSCDFSNSSKKRVQWHKRIHNLAVDSVPSASLDNQVSQVENKVTFYCGVCGYTTVFEELMNTHMATHEESYESDTAVVNMLKGQPVQEVSKVAHPDAEAVNLLNHFKTGQHEVIMEPAMVVAHSETVSTEDVKCFETQVVDNPIPSSAKKARSLLPKNSMALAKNAPQLYHELIKAGGKEAADEHSKVLQEFAIVFDSDDHPAPAGQVILLSEEDAATLQGAST